MDQTLNLKLQEYRQTLTTLNEVINQPKTDFIRDALIKRFEYVFEICWKSAKIFLSVKYGLDVNSPKECFRSLRKNNLITDEHTEKLLEMVDSRNMVIHMYDLKFAEELYNKIIGEYHSLLEEIYDIIKK